MTEVEENTCTTTPGTSNFTRSGNPASNSKKATGQRIITTSDQVKNLSETMPTENGTRLPSLDRTLLMGLSNIGSIDVDNYIDARLTTRCPTRHSSALIKPPKDNPQTTPGTTDSCTDCT